MYLLQFEGMRNTGAGLLNSFAPFLLFLLRGLVCWFGSVFEIGSLDVTQAGFTGLGLGDPFVSVSPGAGTLGAAAICWPCSNS